MRRLVTLAFSPMLAVSAAVHAAPPEGVAPARPAASAVRVEHHEHGKKDKPQVRAQMKTAPAALQAGGRPQEAPVK